MWYCSRVVVYGICSSKVATLEILNVFLKFRQYPSTAELYSKIVLGKVPV
jgi:hypothetical protein